MPRTTRAPAPNWPTSTAFGTGLDWKWHAKNSATVAYYINKDDQEQDRRNEVPRHQQ
jgi:hypothetical protein